MRVRIASDAWGRRQPPARVHHAHLNRELRCMLTRRSAIKAAAGLAAASAAGVAGPAYAADQIVKVGINLSFTGADATSAMRIANGAIMAFDDANTKNEVKGVKFVLVKYDDGTA